MRIVPKKDRDCLLIDVLTEVWRRSVLATHHFLTAEDIGRIAEYVPEALREVEYLVIAEEREQALGFMGLNGQKIEMLFVAPEYRGKGYGSRFVQYAFKHFAANEVTVNEQNPLAVGFYEHLGFVVYKRTPKDEQGGPFPLLYMKKK